MKKSRFLSLFLSLTLLLALFPSVCAADEFSADARAALLIEYETGEVLYEKNAQRENYPASITKVMTALLVLEAVEQGQLSLSQELTVTEDAFADLPWDASTAGLKVGEVLSLEDMLYCLLLPSGNEAGNILAAATDGSVEAFVAHMNRRAQELGCTHTHFMNPHGLHHDNHYTSAWDIYLFTRAAMQYDKFMEICGSRSHELPETEFNPKRTINSTNYLISGVRTNYYLYAGAQGVKTGSTGEAGHCLVATAMRGTRRLLTVVLGAERVVEDNVTITKSFTETARLFDHGFDDFMSKDILLASELIWEIPVTLSSEMDYVVLHPAEDLTRMLPNDLDPAELTRDVKPYADSVEAPIAAGDELGEITLSYGKTVYGTVPLLALSDVSASWLLVAQRDVLAFLAQRWVKLALIGLAALIVLILVLRAVLSSKNRRYGRRRSREQVYSGYRGKKRR